MAFKSISLAATILVLSTSVNAAIISTDWQTIGDNLITQDMTSGLEWLDLTVTANQSYDDVSSQLGSGGEFEGWRYATQLDVSGFFDAFGGNSAYYDGLSTQNNGLFGVVAPIWGDLLCASSDCAVGEGFSAFVTAEAITETYQYVGIISNDISDPSSADNDFIKLAYIAYQNNLSQATIGHALVRDVGTVPVPAAVWLFGSGLIGLIGVARRKK